MSANSFLQADGTLNQPHAWWWEWLPSRRQMVNALQLQFERVWEQEQPVAIDENSTWATSMRQGIGMILALGLLAGVLPFLVNWYTAGQVGAVLPLANLAFSAEARQADIPLLLSGPAEVILGTGQTIAGLEPALFPGWLAAGLSALGMWINWPLRWLSLWLVYGLGVLVMAKLLGAPTTLQRFYALTSYAAVPLLLTGLSPIPCLGVLAVVVAFVWASAVYLFAVRAATGLHPGSTLVCMLLPGALALLLGLFAAISSVMTFAAFLTQ